MKVCQKNVPQPFFMEVSMVYENQFDDWIYEKLYGALIKAISKSSEVHEVLDELEKLQLKNKPAAINLILCLDELSEMIHSSNTPKEEQKSSSEEKKEGFDETRWMKQARIKF